MEQSFVLNYKLIDIFPEPLCSTTFLKSVDAKKKGTCNKVSTFLIHEWELYWADQVTLCFHLCIE